jgi:multidrug efflux pump subunit AcrB
MSPSGSWLPFTLAALSVLCCCHRGRTPEAGPKAPETLTVLLHGAPDSQALCRAADAIEESLAGEAFVKSLRIAGQSEDEIVIEADPDKLSTVGVDFSTLAEALRQGLPAVPREDMVVDDEKKAVVVTMNECKPLDLDADRIMTVTVKDPKGNFIPLGFLAVLKIRAGKAGFFHKGERALKIRIALADSASYEEARASLGRALAESLEGSLIQWEMP